MNWKSPVNSKIPSRYEVAFPVPSLCQRGNTCREIALHNPGYRPLQSHILRIIPFRQIEKTTNIDILDEQEFEYQRLQKQKEKEIRLLREREKEAERLEIKRKKDLEREQKEKEKEEEKERLYMQELLGLDYDNELDQGKDKSKDKVNNKDKNKDKEKDKQNNANVNKGQQASKQPQTARRQGKSQIQDNNNKDKDKKDIEKEKEKEKQREIELEKKKEQEKQQELEQEMERQREIERLEEIEKQQILEGIGSFKIMCIPPSAYTAKLERIQSPWELMQFEIAWSDVIRSTPHQKWKKPVDKNLILASNVMANQQQEIEKEPQLQQQSKSLAQKALKAMFASQSKQTEIGDDLQQRIYNPGFVSPHITIRKFNKQRGLDKKIPGLFVDEGQQIQQSTSSTSSSSPQQQVQQKQQNTQYNQQSLQQSSYIGQDKRSIDANEDTERIASFLYRQHQDQHEYQKGGVICGVDESCSGVYLYPKGLKAKKKNNIVQENKTKRDQNNNNQVSKYTKLRRQQRLQDRDLAAGIFCGAAYLEEQGDYVLQFRINTRAGNKKGVQICGFIWSDKSPVDLYSINV
ncbi:MAG: hypothetical protein EZS28_019593 [Streblomastix strix]|uniref:Uncharacterized protein n=1 Tax=Streblomastix strix TaxID=222440 RepID=A0A5J4VQD3_9EUKA|nr:MAG: hypothetical protein EZS28_019593 [Streblomastix strix]